MQMIASSESILSFADMVALLTSANELTAETDLQQFLHGLLVKAAAMTDSAEGSVILYDQQRDSLYFIASIGAGADQLLSEWGECGERRIPIPGSKAGEVFTTGRCLVAEALDVDDSHYKEVDEQLNRRTSSMICVPLTAAGERMGVMQVLNKQSGSYTERDQLLVEYFGNQAGLAVRNNCLSQRLLDQMGFYTCRDRTRGALELLAQLEEPARSEQVTVMFTDLRGFTQLCQILNSPVRTQQFLNEFLTMLADLTIEHRGVVNKFLGDTVLSFFRHQDSLSDSCERAIRCAFAMIEQFQEMQRKWDEEINQQIDFLDIGIGIVTDNVILGAIGHPRLRDFSALGTPVNLAAAFSSSARDGKRVLVDQITYRAIKNLVADAEGPLSHELGISEHRVSYCYKKYHIKRLAAKARSRLFISHASEDRSFVEEELVRVLPGYGIETWYSGSEISGGQNWVRAIYEGLQESDGVVVVVSQNSALSEWVRQEIDYAVSDGRLRGRIIPVVLDDTTLHEVHPYLGPVQAIDVRHERSLADRLHEWLNGQSARS